MKSGEARYGALLTPQGKVLFDFFILRRADDFILDTEATQTDALIKRLSLYRLRADVAIEDAAGELAAAQIFGDDVAAPPPPPAGYVFPDPRLAALGFRMIAPPDAIANAGAACGAEEAAYLRRRLALGVPESPADIIPEQSFPLDANMDALNAIDFRKGCFVGQEVTSRAKRRGEIRKRTLIIRYDGAPPAPGTPVTAGDSILGETLSGADNLGLAVIRTDRLAAARARGDAPEAGGRRVELAAPDYLESDL
ncbi:MAG: folate-binding protein YgfZ [Parvularculaceae bacterium]